MKKSIIAILIALAIVAGIVVFGQIFNLDTVSVRFENFSSVSEEEIISKSGVSAGQNIFVLSDKTIKTNVEAAYPDHSVAVTDVEKIFPNKLVLTVRIRKPVFMFEAVDDERVVPTDMDFQLNKLKDANSVDFNALIRVNGLKVDGSFDLEPFKNLRRASKAFIANGFTEASFLSFFSAVDYASDKISFILRDFDDSRIVVSLENASDDAMLIEVGRLMDKFYSIPESERTGISVTL